jgi:aldehyde dehydrogenase (NAD+)
MTIDLNEQYGLYIDGEQREGNETFDVYDPATDELLTTVSEAGREGVNEAIRAAEDAVSKWIQVGHVERGQVLRDISNALRVEQEHLARIETAETGRPISESQSIVTDAISLFDYNAGLTDKVQGDTIPVPGERLNYTVREPLGVTGHIVPWNAAFILGARSIAPALAFGNTAVVKPSPEAPLSLLEMARIMHQAGLPSGVLNVVPGDGARSGAALTNDTRLGGLVFTGSRTTGKVVMKNAANNITPVGLELGGKNPSIIFPDADLEKALEDTLKVFSNTGQVCYATSRLFIHDEIYDDFIERLIEQVSSLNFGPGAEDYDLGPLITSEARGQVANYVTTAVDNGARLLTGGYIPDRPGNFYPPTVIDEIGDDTPISCEEVFGPVLTMYRFEEESEVIERANDTDFGLYAAVWTNDLTRAHQVTSALEAGTISVNEYPATFPQTPFGGYKQSGIGREKGIQAMDHYTQRKNVTIALGDTPRALFE